MMHRAAEHHFLHHAYQLEDTLMMHRAAEHHFLHYAYQIEDTLMMQKRPNGRERATLPCSFGTLSRLVRACCRGNVCEIIGQPELAGEDVPMDQGFLSKHVLHFIAQEFRIF